MIRNGFSRLFSLIRVLVLGLALISEAYGLSALKPDMESSQSGRGRRPGKGGLFQRLEVFKNNLDIFAGPAFHTASGPYLDELPVILRAPQKNFHSAESKVESSFFTVIGGVQYRIVPGAKEKNIMRFLSYAVGLHFQRSGFSYRLDKNRIPVGPDGLRLDNLLIEQKIRANYLCVPLSVRFGKRLFAEAGLNLNFLLNGSAEYVEFARDGIFDKTSLSASKPTVVVFNLRPVMPLVSPGFSLSGGLNFNENIGIRLSGYFTGGFFKDDSNPANTNFKSSFLSVQLIGSIN